MNISFLILSSFSSFVIYTVAAMMFDTIPAFLSASLFMVMMIYFKIRGDNESKQKIDLVRDQIDILKKDNSIEDEHFFVDYQSQTFLGISELNSVLVVGEIKNGSYLKHKIFTSNQILGAAIIRDGKSLKDTGVSSLGGAAIGGVLFGGTGAIVGAIVGSNGTEKVRSITLNINIDNIGDPYFSLRLLNVEMDVRHPIYSHAMLTAEKWLGSIEVFIRRTKQA